MTIRIGAALWSGITAGVVSTLAQAAVWLLVTDRFPAILFRDARLTAAIVLGHRVLPPPETFDVTVMITAGAIHVFLSAVYGLVLALALERAGNRHGALIGVVFGLALYAVNLYGFTALFPWFSRVRDANTFMAHIVFGLTGAGVYRVLTGRSRGDKPAGG